MPLTPSDFLYFPVKNGNWLRDSQGKPRIYKSATAAVRNLEKQDYDLIQVYAIDDVLTREEFEKGCELENDRTKIHNR